MPTEIEIRRLPDDDGEEEWERVTLGDDEDDVHGVSALRSDEDRWSRTVFVSALEFVRTDPLESEIRAAMNRALAAVPGVTAAIEEDREVWGIEGSASGEALTRTAAEVIDTFADRIREHIAALVPEIPVEMFHVTAVENRASIERHGLDSQRMGAARGIAGSLAPEIDGVFLARGDFEARWFARFPNAPTDIWAVRVVGLELEESEDGFTFVRGTIGRDRIRLHQSDVPASPLFDEEP